ncbi:MAG: type II/IV secretion system protein [Candidatus Andersenbacteria bacterium]|nr:type II/IV secretion system protein [Candidatus Andersenbacteria bacterium]MBI3250947.1 type II/IV secretion system protein [Candidatus Andersenbacteria bacterium]
MAENTGVKILQSLAEKQLITFEQANQLRGQIEGGANLYELLVDGKVVNEDQYMEAYAAAVEIPYVNVGEMQIPKEILDIVPESTARGHRIVAYEQTPDLVKVAMADPSDRQIVEFIRKKVDVPVEVAITSPSSIRKVLAQYQDTLEAELSNLIKQAQTVTGTGELTKVAEDLPTVKITEAILKHAILQGASDIHIEPTEDQLIVRYRVDGLLHNVLTLPKAVMAGLVARIKILSRLKIDEHRLPQDGRFKLESDDYQVAFRVSTLPVFDGEKVVMRLLDESGQGLKLDDIGMNDKALKVFRKNINEPHGMVLVTGPTGSGKTTTLYAAMRELNQPEVNISTIEDPIEYRMEKINQTQVQPKIGLNFATGLRALVRQDPDIIMVGEIRDEETASLAVNAALTGHMVLSTLHTNSAAGAVPRMLDMKVEPFLIATTANALLAQRLVRKLCQECKVAGKADKTIMDSLAAALDIEHMLKVLQEQGAVKKEAAWEDIPIFQPKGCPKCQDGYRGRLGIYEIFELSPAIQKLITSNVTSQDIETKAREEQGMVTMIEDGMIKVTQGITSVEEILRVAKE